MFDAPHPLVCPLLVFPALRFFFLSQTLAKPIMAKGSPIFRQTSKFAIVDYIHFLISKNII
jgi:hypothetical protein